MPNEDKFRDIYRFVGIYSQDDSLWNSDAASETGRTRKQKRQTDQAKHFA